MTTNARIPQGSREYLLDRADRLVDAINTCAQTFADWGARRIIPSTLIPYEEATDPATAIAFSEAETGRMLALRQDMTNSVRRIVDMELKHLPTPFKLFYVERVWQSATQGSRAKEQIQAGAEWIGPGQNAESAILALTADLIDKLSRHSATVIVSHADLRKAWLDALDIKDRTQADDALEQRNLSLWQTSGDPAFKDLPLLSLERDSDIATLPKPVATIIGELQEQLHTLTPTCDVAIDPLGQRDCGYYSGMYFTVASGSEHDPWVRGGRYDGRFSNPADAIGLTLDLDPLMEAIDLRQANRI